MRERWQALTPWVRRFSLGGAGVIAVMIAVIVLAQTGVIAVSVMFLVVVPLSIAYLLLYVVMAIVIRRQELDAAVERGRIYDEKHDTAN